MDQNIILHPTFLLSPETGLPLPFFVQVLYVMELRQDLEKGKATFTAVSEFLLTHPVLSFGVRDVAHSRLRHTEVLPAEEESESLTTGVYVCTDVLYFFDHFCATQKNWYLKTLQLNVKPFSIFVTLMQYLVCACFQRVHKDPQSLSLESKLNSIVFTPSKFLSPSYFSVNKLSEQN